METYFGFSWAIIQYVVADKITQWSEAKGLIILKPLYGAVSIYFMMTC